MRRSQPALVALLVALALLSACAGARRETVGRTTTTASEPVYRPGAVELYVTRSNLGAPCLNQLAPVIDFAPHTDEPLGSEMAELDAWAACLRRAETMDAKVVVLGSDEASGPEGLFLSRAARVRKHLVERGVDASRVVVGAERDPLLKPHDTGIRYGF